MKYIITESQYNKLSEEQVDFDSYLKNRYPNIDNLKMSRFNTMGQGLGRKYCNSFPASAAHIISSRTCSSEHLMVKTFEHQFGIYNTPFSYKIIISYWNQIVKPLILMLFISFVLISRVTYTLDPIDSV